MVLVANKRSMQRCPRRSALAHKAKSLELDGTDEYARDNSAIIPTSGSYTVSIWAKQNTDQQGFREIISQGSNFYVRHTPLRFPGNSSGIDYEIRVGDDWINTGVEFPRDNFWQNYATVRDVDNNNTYLYINGILVASSGFLIESPGFTDDLIIGGQPGSNNHFGGKLDELRIWNRALSADEILCNLNTTLTGNESDLVGYYNFEDNPQGSDCIK